MEKQIPSEPKKAAVLSAARIKTPPHPLAAAFNRSLGFDVRLYPYDIAGSVAHCTMLGACGILTQDETAQIVTGLNEIKARIDNGTLLPNDAEDVHMFVEDALTALIGETGKKLHTARSRNDQVALDFRLFVRDASAAIRAKLKTLVETLLGIAATHAAAVMPGYTHLQKAQPVTFGHHLAAYCEMFLRDLSRFKDNHARLNVLPLGSGALAGTTYPIDRDMTARLLGFDGVCGNSMDGVSDRDFALDFLYASAATGMHLSRLCEELVMWAGGEFGFIEFDEAFSTGSSIMPQKKNPDIAELIRGKTGRLYGNLVTLLTVMKGLPLAYNKDMQEDKEAVFDAFDALSACLDVLSPMLGSMTVHTSALKKAAAEGFTNATDVADYLVKKGLPFRDAHSLTGGIVRYAIQKNTRLDKLSLAEFQSFSPLFGADILPALTLPGVLNAHRSYGGPAPSEVRRQLRGLAKRLEKY